MSNVEIKVEEKNKNEIKGNTGEAIAPSQLLGQLNWRYATKQFDPEKKINEQNWEVVEEALRLSPSSGGLQPWKFVVVTNPEVREKLRPASYGQAQITDASHLVVFAVKTNFGVEH